MKRRPITEVCNFQGGTQPPKKEWIKEPKEGYVRMLQIRDFTQPDKDNIEYVSIKSNLKTCESDDILIGRYGASIGKILTGLEGAYNVAIVKTEPDLEKLDKKFLYYILKSDLFQNFVQNVGSRAAQAGFNMGDLEDFKIPLPSLSEQKAIVAKLDRAQRLIDIDKAMLAKYDQLIQSVFLDMFGDPVTNEKGWEKIAMGDLMKIVRGGSPRPIKEFLGGSYPWIKIGDATKGDDIYLHSTKEKIIEAGLGKTRLLPKGSLIFANCGVSLGFARIIKFQGCIHDGWLAFSEFDEEKIDKIFLLKALNSVTQYFRETAPDGTQPNLNTTIMKKYEIILPPITLQRKYVKTLESMHNEKAILLSTFKKSEELFSSLVQEVFG